MQHSIGNEHVGIDHPGKICEDGAVVSDDDLQIVALQGGQASVAQNCAVTDCALHDVILKDVSELPVRDSSAAICKCLEGVVVWAEDGDVRKLLQCRHYAGLSGCASESGEVATDESLGDTQWDGQKLVDDVNDAVVELDVLVEVTNLSMCQGQSDSRHLQQSRSG